MTHIEPIESRLLAHVSGLDAAFGTEGVAALGSRYSVVSVLPTSSAVFVDTLYKFDPTQRFVQKLSADGTLDTTWGNGGRVNVLPGALAYGGASDATSGLPTQSRLAFDEATGNLYVAGRPSLASGSGITVQRLIPGGAFDPTFGTDGTVRQAVAAGGPTASSGLYVNALASLPGGKLLMSVQSEVATVRTGGGTNKAVEFQLRRLNANGTPDTSFDGDGTTVVARGSSSTDGGETTSSGRSSVNVFGDWQVNADGSVRVASLLDNSKYSDDISGNESTVTLRNVQYVQRDLIAADGVVATEAVTSLAKNAYSNAVQRRRIIFRPRQLVVDGRSVRVVGLRAASSDVTPPTARLTRINVTPNGVRLSPVVFDKRLTGAFLGLGGDLARTAVFSDTRLKAIDANRPSRTFGDASGSVVLSDGGDAPFSLSIPPVVDADGRVLAVSGRSVYRFVG